MVVLPTPPFLVRTGMYFVPPSSNAPILASIALRALTLGESPKLISFRLIKKTKRRQPDSGAARNFADASISLSAVSIAAGSGSSKVSPRRLSLREYPALTWSCSSVTTGSSSCALVSGITSMEDVAGEMSTSFETTES